MALNTNKELKLYYSISEVAEMFDVNESLLRFWEKEFPQIKPRKTSGGTRQYRKEDIETIKLIYHLVKEKGYTLDGARIALTTNNKISDTVSMIERLEFVKAELLKIKDSLAENPKSE